MVRETLFLVSTGSGLARRGTESGTREPSYVIKVAEGGDKRYRRVLGMEIKRRIAT